MSAEYGDVIRRCIRREFIIVCGAEDYYTRAGNLLMFMAHAVRYVRKYASSFDLTTVFVFPGKVHTRGHLDAVKTGIEKYGGTYFPVTSWSEVAAHINKKTVEIDGATCDKRVQTLIFFAHGQPGRIWLVADEGLYLTANDLSQVDAGSFVDKDDHGSVSSFRHVTSWACQTGNNNSHSTKDDARANSLAQAMANAWDIHVFASITRTDYTDTWEGWRPWDRNTDRIEVDGGVWEPDGADGSVRSGTGSDQGNMPSGMFLFKPGQTSDYEERWLD